MTDRVGKIIYGFSIAFNLLGLRMYLVEALGLRPPIAYVFVLLVSGVLMYPLESRWPRWWTWPLLAATGFVFGVIQVAWPGL
jgi:hypothetical protein